MGQPIPTQVDDGAVDALRARLDAEGATAVLALDGDDPVAGCFATAAVIGGKPVRNRAHISGMSVDPRRWGRGLATLAMEHLEAALFRRGYDTAQLAVLETNNRARSLYEHLGWRLVRVGERHPAGPHALYEKSLLSKLGPEQEHGCR